MTDFTHFSLLAASMRDRDVWDAFDASGEAAKAPEDLAPFVEAVRAFYTTDPNVRAVEPSLIGAATAGITRDPKRKEAMRATLAALTSAAVSVPNVKAAMRAVQSRRVGEALATKLLIPSKDGPTEIAALMDEYIGLQSAGERDDSPDWSAEALADVLGEATVPIYPRSIGQRLRGGLRPGHHMIVFARPEMGKTALALHMAVMAASRKANVLYCTNEDAVRDLMMRSLMLFNRQSFEWTEKNTGQAIMVARGFGADRIRFHDMAPGALAEVDRMVRKTRPDFVVIDQLRNMAGGKTENMTQKLDSLAQGARNIGKRHGCAVLSLTQAGDSARNKAVLDDGDVDNSNTGISAGCSVLIGMGATPAMMEAGERRLTFIKNKLGGAHGYADVRFDPLTLAFRDP